MNDLVQLPLLPLSVCLRTRNQTLWRKRRILHRELFVRFLPSENHAAHLKKLAE